MFVNLQSLVLKQAVLVYHARSHLSYKALAFLVLVHTYITIIPFALVA